MRNRLALTELEFQRDRLPGHLELAADHAHNALENLLFNFGDLSAQVAALALASKEQIDHRKCHRQIQLQYRRRARREKVTGCDVRSFRQALKEFLIGQVLG